MHRGRSRCRFGLASTLRLAALQAAPRRSVSIIGMARISSLPCTVQHTRCKHPPTSSAAWKWTRASPSTSLDARWAPRAMPLSAPMPCGGGRAGMCGLPSGNGEDEMAGGKKQDATQPCPSAWRIAGNVWKQLFPAGREVCSEACGGSLLKACPQSSHCLPSQPDGETTSAPTRQGTRCTADFEPRVHCKFPSQLSNHTSARAGHNTPRLPRSCPPLCCAAPPWCKLTALAGTRGLAQSARQHRRQCRKDTRCG